MVLARFIVGGALALSLAGQVSPGLSRGPAPSAVFDAGQPTMQALGARTVEQVGFWHLLGDAPGSYTTALTIFDLSAGYGGSAGTVGVVLGTFDLAARTFTPSKSAAAINGSEHDVGLKIEPRLGRYAVLDRYDSAGSHVGVFLAARPSALHAFGPAVPVTGLPGVGMLPFADPVLGHLGGKLMLFYGADVGGMAGIYRIELDVTNPAAPRGTGAPVLVVRPALGGIVHSPFPLHGPDGDAEGILYAEALLPALTDSDFFFANDLDPGTPAAMLIDSAGWLNSGAVAGGLFAVGDRANSRWARTTDAEGAWLLGDVEPPGGTLDVVAGATDHGGMGAVFTQVFADVGLNAAPISVPPIHGSYALGAAPIPIVPPLAHDANGIGALAIPVPNDPALSGVRVALQGLAFQPATGTLTMTNDAWLAVR